MKEYLAHISDDKREQSIYEHANSVSALAESFAKGGFKELVSKLGLYHDIGKYAESFQNRLKGSNIKFEHSICGAIELQRTTCKNDIISLLMQYCIAGHHTGLPDGGTKADLEDSTLMARLQRKNNYTDANDYHAFEKEIEIKVQDFSELIRWISYGCTTKEDLLEKYSFLTRYAFSCLVDADFIDTELFCNPKIKRGINGNFKKALNILDERLLSFKQDTAVRRARTILLQQAVNNYNKSNIHVLNMPTGSGKTLCSLKLALEEVIKTEKKRIIYIIPYTSIIEQTANDFEQMFGDVLPILQHHSNYSYNIDSEFNSTNQKLKKSCENWDAPLIVTTSVQFFQSLYHYKSSSLRKLHNLADSIIILDEIHLIPIEYIQPCLRAIGFIGENLNSEFIFLSATMPSYTDLFKRYIPNCKINELIKDKIEFTHFQNCKYINLSKTEYESVVEKSNEFLSTLIIVNKRKTAKEVYKLVNGNKYHLSTYMSPYHRSKTIENIKSDLKKGIKITVISTSLIEAGVDLDFEVVFRELTGLDSILQAGGRCNREGKNPNGNVFIFETNEKIKNSDIATRKNITKYLLNKYTNINCLECIEEYYSKLFAVDDDKIKINSIVNFDGKNNCFEKGANKTPLLPFRSYALNFRYIKSETISIIINHKDEKCLELISKLKSDNLGIKRDLQKYSISVYSYEFDNMLKLGALSEIVDGVYLLSNMSYYDDYVGLSSEFIRDEDYII